ncbi:MAG: hypothetical protein A2X55_07845 [Nitrospirae bacterium GWB2_47_37]|nr:MAG: hypothetical protein A2X55_07845 [Nitrospirae bacterium GWB2_47_37]
MKKSPNNDFFGRGYEAPFEMIITDAISRKAIEIYCRGRAVREAKGKTQKELGAYFGISRQKFNELSNILIKHGWVEARSAYGSPLTYTFLEPSEKYHGDIHDLLRISETRLKELSIEIIMDEFGKSKMKRVFEALSYAEFSYRESKKAINEPLKLLRKFMNIHIPNDFNLYWFREAIAAKKTEQRLLKKQKQKEKQHKERIEDMKRFLSNLIGDEFAELRERAIKELKDNGGIPDLLAEIAIKNKMYELYQAEEIKTPSLFGGKGK